LAPLDYKFSAPAATVKRLGKSEQKMIRNINLKRVKAGKEHGVLATVDNFPIEHLFVDEKEALEHILFHFFHVDVEENNNGS
jgi:hypothetical protein